LYHRQICFACTRSVIIKRADLYNFGLIAELKSNSSAAKPLRSSWRTAAARLGMGLINSIARARFLK
jgi:hypothetical protein